MYFDSFILGQLFLASSALHQNEYALYIHQLPTSMKMYFDVSYCWTVLNH